MKKIKNTVLLFCMITFFTVVLSSCGPSDEEVYIKIDEEVLAWGAFKEGTYWIYQEENTGTIDSVYVYKQEEAYGESDRGSKKVKITYEVFLGSIFINSINNDTLYYDVTTFSSNILLTRVTRIKNDPARSCNIVPPPYSNFFKEGYTTRTGLLSQKTVFDSIYPIYTLGELEFTNVIRANNNENYAYNGTPTLLYSARNVGMIRKEFPERNEVWNLIRYNVVQ